MKQQVRLNIKFPDSSYQLKISSVYQLDNTLIAIAAVDKKESEGLAIKMPRSARVVVETTGNELLGVKYYAMVSDTLKGVKSFTSTSGLNLIPVIDSLKDVLELKDHSDLTPLPWAEPALSSIFSIRKPDPAEETDLDLMNRRRY